MATLNDWLEGARIRTLPAAIAPVIAGAGIAFGEGKFSVPRTLLACAVALLLQIGVNFANDYSDGIRGTDEFRSGPPRLTGGAKTAPKTVFGAALICFALAALFGLALVSLTGAWWLLIVGACAIIAAWFYTGGKHPYGYIGLGEVFVMIFFGYVATVGTVYTQTLTMPYLAWIAATGIGLIACALLMINNIRDIPTDRLSGKQTLAVRLGEKYARFTYFLLLLIPFLLLAIGFYAEYPIMLSAFILIPWARFISTPVLHGAKGKELIPVLRQTGFYEIGYALLIAGGIVVSKFTEYTSTIGWSIMLLGLFVWIVFEITAFAKHQRR